MKEKQKIFVTGAQGFIGSHLCEHLVKQGHDLTVLLRAKPLSDEVGHIAEGPIVGRPFLPENATVVFGDILKSQTYQDAMQGCDAVIHLAADYRVGMPCRAAEREKMYKVNVLGTLAIAQAVQDLGIPRMIYASSTAAFGETCGEFPDETHKHNGVFRSYYEETKHIAHRLLERKQEEGVPIAMGIFGGVFGSGDTASVTQTMRDFLKGKLPALPDSKSRFQLCHVSHVCEAFSLLLAHENPQASYLFTGQDYTMSEIIEKLAFLSGKPLPKKLSLKTLAIPARIMDVLSRLGLQVPLSQEVLNVLDGSTYMYSSAKAQAELGWFSGYTHEELESHMRSLLSDAA